MVCSALANVPHRDTCTQTPSTNECHCTHAPWGYGFGEAEKVAQSAAASGLFVLYGHCARRPLLRDWTMTNKIVSRVI